MKRFNQIAPFACLVSSLWFLACKEEPKSIPSEEIKFRQEGILEIYKGDSLTVRGLSIEIADNEFETQTGLMYRSSMEEKQAMLFIFENEEPRYFYMKNTKIPLDIVYMDKDRKVVSFIKDAKPMTESSLPSQFPAKYVLEINAGLAERWNIAIGDSINYRKN